MTTAGESDSDYTAEELRRISDEIAASFPPEPAAASQLVLMDVDPRRVHAYWSVDPAGLRGAGGTAGDMVLRLHDVTGDAGSRPDLDVPVQGLSGREYVDLWEDGRRLQAELGVAGPDGFHALARSNEVALPPAAPSGPEEPAVAATPAADAAFPLVEAAELERYAERAEAFERTFAAAAGDDVPPLPADGVAPPPQRDAQPDPQPQPQAPSQPATVSHSSFGLAAGGTDLEIQAELHVYGRAKPGSELHLFGRRVPLRPDGSFSVRRPLPQGAVVLPLSLTVGDDDETGSG